MDDLNYNIDWIGGNCPVQAEGTYQGKNLYFRSRGNHWTLYIGDPDVFADDAWSYGEPYGDEPFVAGWITEEQAIGFIEQALRLYNNR